MERRVIATISHLMWINKNCVVSKSKNKGESLEGNNEVN